MCVLLYRRFVSMEIHAKVPLWGRGLRWSGEERVKVPLHAAAAAAAAQLMGNRLRGTWPMGIRRRSDHREDFIKNAEAPGSSLLL